jgi:hypothetical protein
MIQPCRSRIPAGSRASAAPAPWSPRRCASSARVRPGVTTGELDREHAIVVTEENPIVLTA